MRKDNRVELSNEELEIIRILEHSLFSDKILTDELNDNSCSLMQVRAEGFFEAVSLMAKPEVQERIYRKVSREYEMEDILLHLESMEEKDLCGFRVDDITQDDVTINKIWNALENGGDCNVPYNDQVDEAIKTILEQKHLGEVSK